MKELIPAIWCDVTWREEKRKTPAAVTRRIALDGREIELDLTDEHDKELREFLARYMDAGRVPQEEVPARPARDPGQGSPGRRAYLAAAREFAKVRGLPTTTQTGKRTDYLSVRVLDTYEAHLAGQDWRVAWENWKPRTPGQRSG